MEGERQKKIKAGKEKLEAYKKRKSPRSKSSKSSNENSASSDNSQSDFSFSISVTPPLLPDNNKTNIVPLQSSGAFAIKNHQSDDSDTIAENIEPDNLSNSENDRSLHEIEITNLPNDETSNINFYINAASDTIVNLTEDNFIKNEINLDSSELLNSTKDRIVSESVDFKNNILVLTDSKEPMLVINSDLLNSPITINTLNKQPDISTQSYVSESASSYTDNLGLKAPNVSLVENTTFEYPTFSTNSDTDKAYKHSASINSIPSIVSKKNMEESNLFDFDLDVTSDLLMQGKNIGALETTSPPNSLQNVDKNLSRETSPRQSNDILLFKESYLENDSVDNLNVTDKSLSRIRNLEEQLSNKDAALAALTAELDSLKEASSNLSTFSLGTATTEYKELAEEYKLKLFEFQTEIVHRDNLIQQLTESLEESLVKREQLQQQSEQLVKEIELLKSQLTETTAIVNAYKWNTNNYFEKPSGSKSLIEPTVSYKIEIENKTKSLENLNATDINIDVQVPKIDKPGDLITIFNKLYKILSPVQIHIFNEFRLSIELFLWQQLVDMKESHASNIKQLVEKFDNEKSEHSVEVSRLRELLSNIKCGSTEIMELREELEAKHNLEMEKLRKFFEKKCVDMEKNYSEEIYSQHSRKHSESSSCSELGSDLLFSGPPALLPENNADNRLSLSNKNLSQLSPSKKHNDDIDSIKSKLENKHRSEIDEIRNEYENKVEIIMANNDTVLQALENEYVEQIESLKSELESMKIEHPTSIGEVASTSEEELAEVVLSYERRLQEQVELARHDMFAALEVHIQNLISNNGDDNQCPNELKQLRDIYTQKYEEKMEDLKKQHSSEISKMKEDHERFIIRSAERQKRRSQEYELQCSIDADQELLIKERDSLKKMAHTLRHIIGELFKYFSNCEEELNNTLIDELVKFGFDDMTKSEVELNESNITINSDEVNTSQVAKIKRVHFTPDITGLIDILDDELFQESFSKNKDLSMEFRSELNTCLQRLKSEASAILTMSIALKQNMQLKEENVKMISEKGSSNESNENNVSLLTRQLMSETKAKNEILLQLKDHKNLVQTLESERLSLEQELMEISNKQKDLEHELDEAKQKIVQLISENGQKEIVSEGYGEIGVSPMAPTVSPRETLMQVLERTKLVLEESGEGIDHAEVLSLLEVLFNASQRAQEDAQKDAHDLQLQVVLQIIQRICCQKVDAADKKLRATIRFLEEQTSERETERDEAQRQLQELHNQLAQRDRDYTNAQHMAAEVENFEQKMQEMETLITTSDVEKQKLETEYKDAVDKIIELREIIQDLESQIEMKVEAELQFQNEIEKLQRALKEQSKSNTELVLELDMFKNGPDSNQLIEHIQHLENDLSLWKIFGSVESLQQITILFKEIYTNLTKQTKDLEALHAAVSSISCSSPSEDVSVGDKGIKGPLPDNNESTELLEWVRKISTALQKHIRVEGAAVKRIKDLEMQLTNSKLRCEDYQVQRDALQDRVSEQMTEISSLEMRLEEQRRLVQTVTKQTNMSLENKVYDLENEIRSLKDTILSREKQIKQLDNILNKTKKQLSESEKELSSTSDNEKEIVMKLKSEIDELISENKSLKSKLNTEVTNSKAIPELMDSILTDKNADIDRLSKAVEEKEKQLQMYTILNISPEQLRQLSESLKEQTEGKSSARTLSDVVSISEFDEADFGMRKAENSIHSMQSLDLIYSKPNKTETPIIKTIENDFNQVFVKEIEGTPFIPPDVSSIHCNELKINDDLSEKSQRSLSEKSKSLSEKRVHFDDKTIIDNLRKEITELKTEIAENLMKIHEYEDQLSILPELENEIMNLQKNIESFNTEKIELKEQIEKIKMSEISIKVDLDETKILLDRKEKELNILKEDIVRRDDMFLNVTKEKQDLKKLVIDIESRVNLLQDYEVLLPEKEAEIHLLKTHIKEINSNLNKLKQLEEESIEKQKEIEKLQFILRDTEKKYESKITETEKYKQEIKLLEDNIKERDERNEKLVKELENRSAKYDNLTQEVSELKNKITEKENTIESIKNDSIENISVREELKISLEKIKQLEDKVADRECEIEIMNEDMNKYHEDITSLQRHIEVSKNNSQSDNSKCAKELKEKDIALKNSRVEISELRKEIIHLQEYLKEKDKIINQMSVDSRTLQIELEKVQNKIQETGNILDLSKKYHDEQRLTSALKTEIKNLKSALLRPEGRSPTPCESVIQEITDRVQRELDYSAQLDSDLINAITEEKVLSNTIVSSNLFDAKSSEIEIITSGKGEVQNKSDCTPRKRLQKVQNFNIEVPSSIQSIECNDLSQLKSEIDSLKEKLKEKDDINLELNKLKSALMEEVKIIQEKFLQEKENCEKLKELLDTEKQNSNTIQSQDADIIENMRVRLEAALDNETELEKLLDTEKQVRDELSIKLKLLQERLEMDLNPEVIVQEHLKIELEKICVEKEQLQCNNNELKHKLEENFKLVEFIKEENKVLKLDITSLKHELMELKKTHNQQLQVKLDQVIDENVNLKIEIQELKSRICDLMKDVEKLSTLMKTHENISLKNRNVESDNEELKRIKRELVDKEREIENTRALLDDFNREKEELKIQLEDFKTDLKAVKNREVKLIEHLAHEREAQLKSPVPTKFLQKLQELKTLLADHVRENKQMSDTVIQLTEERKTLQARIYQLEEIQKTTFQSRVTENEMEERANHIFGKFLRAESYRKALAWQKQYLFAVLYCYEIGKTPSLLQLVGSSKSQNTNTKKRKSFRCAAYAIIALSRMKFLVRRWHTGKRIGGKAWSHQRQQIPIIPNLNSAVPPHILHGMFLRESGVDVNPGTPVTSIPNPNWQNASPPCKDTSNHRWDVTLPPYSNNPSGHGIPLVAPLRAPAVISQYIDRFDQIQQRLGLALNPPP